MGAAGPLALLSLPALALASPRQYYPHTCYAELADPYQLTGTKTGYGPVANHDTTVVGEPGCSPARAWLLARHGTRLPAAQAIAPMRKLLPKIQRQVAGNHLAGRGQLCAEDLARLAAWSPGVEEREEKRLTGSGEREMLGLGERWAARLPWLRGRAVVWGYTDTQRTRESARKFKEGMGRNSSLPPPLDDRRLLAFYNVCGKYKRTIFQGQDTKRGIQELFASYELPDIKAMVGPLNRRLGYRNKTLSVKSVKLMWDMCRYEMSWFPDRDPSTREHSWPWCAVFTDTELRQLEDNEDLFYYYQDGYKYGVTADMTVLLLRDLLASARPGTGRGPGTFYFAHSETLLPLLAQLGIARDQPPLSAQHMPEDRLWRTSLIGGEGANLAMVALDCGSERRLKFYLNERPVDLAGCPGGSCDAADFVQYYAEKASQDFEQVCQVPITFPEEA